MPSRPAVKSCVSSAVLPGSAGPSAAALEVGAQALVHHELRAPHVHFEQPLGVGRPHRRDARAVEHALRPLQRAPHGAAVEHVELHALQVEVRDGGVGRVRLHTEHDIVASLGEQVRDVGADEAGRTGDEDLGQAKREVSPNRMRGRLPPGP
jgi:hypothetical protein